MFEAGDTKGLREIFLDEFKHWKKEKGFINNYTWKKCAERVLDVLKKA